MKRHAAEWQKSTGVEMWVNFKIRENPLEFQGVTDVIGGSGEIRTHERLTPSAVFKTPAYILNFQ